MAPFFLSTFAVEGVGGYCRRNIVFVVMLFRLKLSELMSSIGILSGCSLCFCPLCTGLKVSRLDMYGEKYKPFKGVKYLTKAGKFQVRT